MGALIGREWGGVFQQAASIFGLRMDRLGGLMYGVRSEGGELEWRIDTRFVDQLQSKLVSFLSQVLSCGENSRFVLHGSG